MPPPFENPGYEKAPVLPQRGKDGACKGIIRLCRCCMPLLGNKAGERAYRRSAFRRIGPASEDIRRVLFVAAGAGCRFRSRSSVDGPVIAPCRRREVLAPQAWHRLHSEPCPAWGGKRWWQAAGCLRCRRRGGWRYCLSKQRICPYRFRLTGARRPYDPAKIHGCSPPKM